MASLEPKYRQVLVLRDIQHFSVAETAEALGPQRKSREDAVSGGMVRDNPEINKQISNMTALGRPGVPDDVGPMIAALLSDENRWVNAQRIEVSGGLAL